jgi:hypothetical protein
MPVDAALPRDQRYEETKPGLEAAPGNKRGLRPHLPRHVFPVNCSSEDESPGNSQTLVSDQLNFVGTFNIGTAFSYTYVAELPYAVIGIVQTVVQTPVTPAGVANSTWNGSSRITGNWVPPADVVYDDEGFPIGVTYLATLSSITHTIALGCAFTQCALPPPGTPGSTQSVPEPGILGLALLALGATAAAGRRRRRA